MIARPPIYTRPDTLFPYTPVFRSRRFKPRARVAGQLVVQRLDLVPQAVGFRADLRGWHVVARAPQLAGVGIAHVACTLVDQFHEAHVVAAHGLGDRVPAAPGVRSEEHTSELQSLMRISYAVFCLKKKKATQKHD